MDFMKRNTGKMIIATLAFVGAVLLFISLVTAPEFNFVGGSQILGPFLFLLGTATVCILKMFKTTKPYGMYVLLGTGLLVTVFMIIGFTGIRSGDNAEGLFGALFAFGEMTEGLGTLMNDQLTIDTGIWVRSATRFMYAAMLIVFGLIPLAIGTQKVICNFCCKDKNKPKPSGASEK